MNNRRDKKSNDYDLIEDETKYGEFISSYFGWISPSKQKERAEELNNMTKTKNK